MSRGTVPICSMVADAGLRQRLRDIGLLHLVCTETGDLAFTQPRGQDWLSDLLCESPLFLQALRKSASAWSGRERPADREALPGIWLVPCPLTSRRRVIGYGVAVIITDGLLESEQLHALAQAAKLDLEICRRLIIDLPPVASGEVARLGAMVRFAQEDQASLAEETSALEGVGKQLGESYEEISLLYTIIQSMTVVDRPDRFVSIACQELLATLPYRWIGMAFANDWDRLKTLAGRFIVAGDVTCPEARMRLAVTGLLKASAPGTPLVLEPATNPAHAPYAVFGPTALCQPISTDGTVIGLLIAGDKQTDDTAASSTDIKLLGATASNTAIFLENAALYDNLNAMFLGTVQALTSSIDAKDRYTCGHSERVAHLTKALAKAVGLDEHTVARTHIAGLVHDVGKIGVPERVLLKPGRLTEEEFVWIRKHPEMGYRILKDIPQLEDILPGVLYHHERWDGTGYPAGLAGEDIPLIARLISLADAFDAVSSTRTYRSNLSREEALDEIRDCAGSQFDPELATVFVKLDFSEFDRLVAAHRTLESQNSIEERGVDS